MAWLLLLLATHAATLLLWARFTTWEVGVNAQMITANGSADDLKAGFHSRRTWLRFWFWLGLTALQAAVACVRFGPLAGVLGFVALGLLLGCYFARTFNPLLNVALKLDYKKRFYASPSPTAAFYPDRYIWQHVRAQDGGQHTDAELQDFANQVNQAWLNTALAVGIVADVAFFIWLAL